MRLPFAVLLIAGCAAAPPVDAPRFAPMTSVAADKATVYIYRPTAPFNLGGYPEIFLNGEKKFALHSNGYGAFVLPPGEYEIKAEGSRMGTNWWPRPAIRPIVVQAGREYYVRVIPVLPPGVKPGPHLFAEDNVSRTLITLVPKDEALEEIAKTQLNQ
jgi:Protein of unknown function (DUF2846)